MLAIRTDRTRPRGVRVVRDAPQPRPGPGEVLVRVARAGICATDLEIARGYMDFNGILGHEFVGTVIEGAAELRGRRVVAEINCVAPGVSLDAAARKHAWPRTALGILNRDGAFAEQVCVPAENCHVVPDAIDDDEAVFVEPLAAAAQVVLDHPIQAGMRAAVLGTGRLGLLCAQVLALQPGPLDVLGRNPRSLELCRRLGLHALDAATLAHEPTYDVLVECTGNADGLKLGMKLLRPRGTLVLKSTYARPPTVDLAPLVINELRVVGNRCGPFDVALRLLAAKRVRVRELIAARFPLSRGEEAFAAAADPRNLKVLLEPDA